MSTIKVSPDLGQDEEMVTIQVTNATITAQLVRITPHQ
jgi:hypothetical protein